MTTTIDPGRLSDALDDVLAAAAACLTDPPALRFVSHGAPAVGCELLAVHCEEVRTVPLDQPADIPAAAGQPRVRVASIVATLARPVCATANPSVEQLDTDGHDLAVDGWALYAGLVAATSRTGSPMWSGASRLPRSSSAVLAELQPRQGGYGGWTVTLDVTL